ncbi:hypothetical protein Syun_012601 [Stephania yunnanensis]|uniref:Uncharacterized protein n=1 Tax=Stephania yunnanensis TaxID=152371 RepID=A0AAP0PJM0_9MAGN
MKRTSQNSYLDTQISQSKLRVKEVKEVPLELWLLTALSIPAGYLSDFEKALFLTYSSIMAFDGGMMTRLYTEMGRDLPRVTRQRGPEVAARGISRVADQAKRRLVTTSELVVKTVMEPGGSKGRKQLGGCFKHYMDVTHKKLLHFYTHIEANKICIQEASLTIAFNGVLQLQISFKRQTLAWIHSFLTNLKLKLIFFVSNPLPKSPQLLRNSLLSTLALSSPSSLLAGAVGPRPCYRHRCWFDLAGPLVVIFSVSAVPLVRRVAPYVASSSDPLFLAGAAVNVRPPSPRDLLVCSSSWGRRVSPLIFSTLVATGNSLTRLVRKANIPAPKHKNTHSETL